MLARATGIFFLTPVIGSRNVPLQIKIWLSLFMAIVVFPFVNVPGTIGLDNTMQYSVNLGRELMVGLLIGYIGLLFFSAVLIAGQVIDMQMGFGLVNVIDPMSQTQIPVMGQLKYLIAILIFLMVNGHHWFILAVSKSFEIVPLGAFSYTPEITGSAVQAFSQVFLMSVKIAIPIIGTLLIVDFTLGILARTMPQMNVFIVGFPLKIAVGLAMFIAVLPYFSGFFVRLFNAMQESIFMFIQAAGG